MMKVKCKCGKTAFPSAEAAIHLIKTSKDKTATAVYRCKHTRTWHITTMRKVVVRKAFGGKLWEVSNGKSVMEFDCYMDAARQAIRMSNKYTRNNSTEMVRIK